MFFSKAAGVVTALIGWLVLWGWILDVPLLKSVWPGLVTMKPNTALGFIACGLSLWLLAVRPRDQALIRIAQGAAAFAGLIGLATLSEYLWGWDLRIDQLLFQESAAAVGTSHPGRMSPMTALAFLLAGAALLLQQSGTPGFLRAFQICSLTVLLVSLWNLIAYLYGVQPELLLGHYTQMALHTAAGFMVLAGGLLASRMEAFPMRAFLSDTLGGILMRRLLPATAGVIVLLGWMRLQGESAGLYGTAFGATLFAVTSIVLLAVVIFYVAGLLERLDLLQRQGAEETARQKRLSECILDCIGEGVVAADREGRFLVFNPMAERIVGMRATDAAPGRWSEIYGVFREDGVTAFPSEELAMSRAIRGEDTVDQVEFLRNARNPEGVWISVTGRPLRGEDGRTAGGVVILRDISERRRSAEDLRQAKEAAEAASSAKSRFLANVSHELRSPLNSVIGYSELLLQGQEGPLRAEQKEDVQTILSSGKHLLGLINELIDLAKIEAGKVDLYPEEVSAPALAEEVRKSFSEEVARRGLRLELLVEGAPGPLLADRQRLRQVIVNLVQNALKFTPKGSVTLGVRRSEGGVVFSVQDTGPGIPAEELGRIFERFSQSKSLEKVKKGEGMGLGLHLAKHFVEIHGGRIWAESEPGKGATFFVAMPSRPLAAGQRRPT